MLANVLIRDVLDVVINLLYFIILGRIIISFLWVATQSNPAPIVGQIYRVLFMVTEPLLRPLRNLLPNVQMGMGYLDLSPLALLILLSIIRNLIRAYL